ncbi:oxidation-reduction process [Pristimantis euphronides]
MVFVQDAFVECTKSELDIFDILPIQTSIDKSLYVGMQSIAALADNAPLEFYISVSGEYYYNLNNTPLYINCCIIIQDNTFIPDTSRWSYKLPNHIAFQSGGHYSGRSPYFTIQ